MCWDTGVKVIAGDVIANDVIANDVILPRIRR
jgi:hypothetical protein